MAPPSWVLTFEQGNSGPGPPVSDGMPKTPDKISGPSLGHAIWTSRQLSQVTLTYRKSVRGLGAGTLARLDLLHFFRKVA